MQAFCGHRRNRQFLAKTAWPWSFRRRWSAKRQVAGDAARETSATRSVMRAEAKNCAFSSRASPGRKVDDYSKDGRKMSAKLGRILVVRDSRIDESVALTAAERAAGAAGLAGIRSRRQLDRKWRRKALKRLDSRPELAPGATLGARGKPRQAKGSKAARFPGTDVVLVPFPRDACFAGFRRLLEASGARGRKSPTWGATTFGA
jgi:hypothetical protein